MPRRVPPQVRPGPLSRTDAEALNQALRDLYALVGGFTGAGGVTVSESRTGVTIALDTASSSSGGGGGSLEVKEADGSPDCTDVPTLIVDQATGLAIESGSNSNPVTLELLAASATQMGAVTTGTQTFAGDKTFDDTITVLGNLINFAPSAGANSLSYTEGDGLFIGSNLSAGIFDALGGNVSFYVQTLNNVFSINGPAGMAYQVTTPGPTVSTGISASVGYNKSAGGTGTLTFVGGILTGST